MLWATDRIGSNSPLVTTVTTGTFLTLAMSRCPALSMYQRLTHKPRALYSHALRLSDWQLESGMTVWEPQSNLGASITVRLLYTDLLVAPRGLSDQSA